jgi:CRP-like cAMP-binding protein
MASETNRRRDPEGERDQYTTSRVLSQSLVRLLTDRLPALNRPPLRMASGQVVIAAGHSVLKLPILRAGHIDAVMHVGASHARQVVPTRFGPGELVMLSYLFSDQPSTVDMVAADRVELHWVERRIVERLVQDDPLVARLLVTFLAQRLREVQERERIWVRRGVSARVSAALLRMSEPVGETPGVRRVHATHEQIAHRAGVSRPKASLALKQFEFERVVTLSRGRVDLLDPEALDRKLD